MSTMTTQATHAQVETRAQQTQQTKFDPDPGHTEAMTIAKALMESNRRDYQGLVVAMRGGRGENSRFHPQRAEKALAASWNEEGSLRPRSVELVRRRGVAMCLVEDRPHVMFPLSALGKAVFHALCELDDASDGVSP